MRHTDFVQITGEPLGSAPGVDDCLAHRCMAHREILARPEDACPICEMADVREHLHTAVHTAELAAIRWQEIAMTEMLQPLVEALPQIRYAGDERAYIADVITYIGHLEAALCRRAFQSDEP